MAVLSSNVRCAAVLSPTIIGEPPTEHYERGPGYNNPISHLMSEFSSLWSSRKVACIISIGTGCPLSSNVVLLDADYFSNLIEETERTAEDFYGWWTIISMSV